MEYTFNNETKINDILTNYDKVNLNIVNVEAGTSLDNIKDLLVQISELPDSEFRFFDVRLKALESEEKAELLKFAFEKELCITNIIETFVLLVNSSNNYNPEFFDAPSVLFSSVVDYLDVCDLVEDQMNQLREKIAFYFFAIMKSYVNHPRFILNETSNCTEMPEMYESILMLLDFFNISFILNTPKLKVPSFEEIPNNLKTKTKILDLWSDKQKFVMSTLSELSKFINEKLAEEKTEE